MTEPSRTQFEKFIRGTGVRQVRFACGLVLFAYLVSHFPVSYTHLTLPTIYSV